MEALVLENIEHRFGTKEAVRGLSLSLAQGEMLCLLGPSGCGKTTALRLVAGLEKLQKGQIFLQGNLVANQQEELPPEERSVGLVFQDYALFPHLTVAENIAFGLEKGADRKSIQKKVETVLGQVGLPDVGRSFPHELSGGQQQRIALARALCPGPELMLLDEPFSGLDSTLRGEVRDQALHILRETGAATLMVTHDPEEAMFMADRIALMRDGKIVQIGTPSELYFNPIDSFTASFFGEVNRLPGRVSSGEVQTLLGDFDAKELSEGQEVQIIVRPEALKLLPPGEHAGSGKAPVFVEEARLLGRTSLIHLSVGEGENELHLHARVPGRFLPSSGESFNLDLDRTQAFVFPQGD